MCLSTMGGNKPKKPKKAKYSKEAVESFYERGERVYQVDAEASIYLFMKAAKGGHAKAMTRLGHCYETGSGVQASRKLAIDWYEQAVAAGDFSPLYNIGRLYEAGDPRKRIPPDYAKVIEWYEKAVVQNSLKACAGVAKIYATADDPRFHDGAKAVKYASVLVQKSPNDAQSHALLAAAYARNLEFGKAVKSGAQAAGMSSLDLVETRRKHLAGYKIGRPFPAVATDSWIFLAADAGSQWAMVTLARMHADVAGKMYDLTKARQWYARAAEAGAVEVLVDLGELCRAGRGGPVDNRMAFNCFRKAADLGQTEAYAPLARMYLGGKGADTNYKLAREWFEKAHAAGDRTVSLESQVFRHLGEAAEHESGEQLFAKGKELAGTRARAGGSSSWAMKLYTYYWLSAEKGNVDAMREMAKMNYLGRAYCITAEAPDPKGLMIGVNYRKALDWYEQLAQKGIVLPELEKCRELCAAGVFQPKKPKKKHD